MTLKVLWNAFNPDLSKLCECKNVKKVMYEHYKDNTARLVVFYIENSEEYKKLAEVGHREYIEIHTIDDIWNIYQ